MVVTFVVVPARASANNEKSIPASQICSRRTLLVSAGVALGTFLSRDVANAFGLPKLEIPEISMPSMPSMPPMPPMPSIETVKDVDTPMNIDTSSLEEKLLAKSKAKKASASSSGGTQSEE